MSAMLVALVGATLVAPVSPVAAQVTAPVDCPDVREADELSPGDVGIGFTVSRGTEPEPFDVEIVDVMPNALAPGVPLIVVEVDSPEIDRVGGIWAGMSGSPVYVDGELIGAVAYGFSLGPSKLGGVTPASAMLAVPNRPTLPPPPGASSVTTSSTVRDVAVSDHGMSRSAARTMRQLEIPVRMTGPTGAKFDRVATSFERAHPGTNVVRGAGAGAVGAEAEQIVAGGNLAVSLTYGDFTAAGVGTATTVCDGVVTGFGHPMLFDGATRLGMHGASAVRVVDDPTLGGYKLANITAEPVGTIDQDRLAAVAGRVGVLPPTTAIRTSILNTEDGVTTPGWTDAIFPDYLFGAVLIHGWTTFDTTVFDDLFYAGTSEVDWVIRGERRGGTPFEVTRSNRHASSEDLSSASLFEVAAAAQSLHGNPYEEVRVTDVEYEAVTAEGYQALRILPRRITASVDGGPFEPVGHGLELVPGADVRLRVGLQPHRAPLRFETITLPVPDGIEGYGSITVTGGGDEYEDPFDCLFFPEDCATDAEGFDDLLDSIAAAPRNDDLVATLTLYDEYDDEYGDGFGQGDDTMPVLAESLVRLDQVVTGYADVSVFAFGDDDDGGGDGDGGEEPICPPGLPARFVDVATSSTHAKAVACAAHLGVTEGVSKDPPRFAPERSVTRGQAATFLVRSLEFGPRNLPAVSRTRFTDVVGSVHATNIERLAAAGIVRGRTTTTFDPQAPVTRAQMATMLVGALRWSTREVFVAEDGPHFPDVGGVHAPNIDAAYELGLVAGRRDGTFDPSASTRRDQMATLVVRFISTLVDG